MAQEAIGSSVRSAIRTLEILEYFQEVQRPIRLKELVERYDYPASSAADLLKTLVARGYISFDRSQRSYFPTRHLSDLVGWLPNTSFEAGIVKLAMERLAQSTRELVVLATPIDIQIEFCETLRSTHDIQLWRAPGTRRLLVQTGIGMLYLSQLSHPQKNDFYLLEATRLYRKTVESGALNENDFSLDEFLGHIKRLRLQDFAFMRSSDYRGTPPGQPGIAVASMMLPTPPFHRPLILGVGGPEARMTANLDYILQQMRHEVSTIAASLDRTSAAT